ncbi:ribonuclease III [Roseobacter phage RDJL Phi 2]|uniref:Ribonuclease III n=1 Tax=Roseobacter phage RDJL Phi 2 TaxID=1682380 RepID=A0A0K0PVV6_9CAUD|nr:ribonuclease III [Roseobacter phage RDJL Phi 2]AKQ75864.1 ribonuclease III [Roseobacter phage RDJL Phi 2]
MTTPNFAITELAASQAQKYVTVNEAFRVVDTAMNLTVIRADNTAPPGSPSEGDKYIPFATATGAWVGQEGNIACYINAEWIFFTPAEGWRAYNQTTNTLMIWNGAAWIDFSASILASASNGSAAAPTYSFASDTDTGMYRNAANELGFSAGGAEKFKVTTSQLISSTADVLFNNAGSNSQITVNKNAAGDNSIVNFQTGFSHHASVGLQGNNDFTIKVGTGFDIAQVIQNDLSATDFYTPEVNVNEANGGALRLRVIEEELTGLSGATVTTTAAFPNQSIILGVSLRVTTTITGATNFDCGDGTTAGRFGGSLGLAAGTTNQGTIGPSGNYGTTNVVLTANGSNFTAGAVRVCLIYLELIAPTS